MNNYKIPTEQKIQVIALATYAKQRLDKIVNDILSDDINSATATVDLSLSDTLETLYNILFEIESAQ